MSQIATKLLGWDTNEINLGTEIFLPKIAFYVHENPPLKLRVVFKAKNRGFSTFKKNLIPYNLYLRKCLWIIQSIKMTGLSKLETLRYSILNEYN